MASSLTGFASGIVAWVKNGLNYTQEGLAAVDVDGNAAVLAVHTGGLSNVSVGAAGANAGASGGLPAGCLKGAPGRVCKAQVTAAGNGSVALNIYDNAAGTATGTVIGVIKANAAAGDQYTFDMPAAAGISIPAQANAPTVTLSYS
jgi:hypothetical protein